MKNKTYIKKCLRPIIQTGFLFKIFTSTALAAPTVDSVMLLKGDLKNGKEIYHTCALCHTPEGWGTVDGYYPQLSGQHPSVLIKQLIDIKLGKRVVPTMVPFADQVFDKNLQGVADVVNYIESLPMTPENSKGTGENLTLGKEIYKQCQSCHGENAEGNNEKKIPLLQGQHYEYLLRQVKWIKKGRRMNDTKKMQHVTLKLTENDMQAVADFISRIKAEKNKVAESVTWKNPDFHGSFVSVPLKKNKKLKKN